MPPLRGLNGGHHVPIKAQYDFAHMVDGYSITPSAHLLDCSLDRRPVISEPVDPGLDPGHQPGASTFNSVQHGISPPFVVKLLLSRTGTVRLPSSERLQFGHDSQFRSTSALGFNVRPPNKMARTAGVLFGQVADHRSRLQLHPIFSFPLPSWQKTMETGLTDLAISLTLHQLQYVTTIQIQGTAVPLFPGQY